MTRPLLLDLYCCSGGAAKGYHRAGFDVIGVDIEDRPRYPFRMIKANALDVLDDMIERRGRGEIFARQDEAVAVHASPSCQKDNPMTKGTNKGKRDHLHRSWTAETRELLDRLGLPYVIEQPVGSGEIRRDLTLCMDMFYSRDFPPPWVQRHRDFELSGFEVPQPYHPTYPNMVGQHRGYVRGMRHGVNRQGAEAPYIAAYGKGGGKATVPEMQHAMGIDWTDVHEELTEAIPPAFTEFISRYLYCDIITQAAVEDLSRPGS